jgi:hypothetical protein
MKFYNTANIPTDLAKKSFAAGIARVMPNGDAPLFAMSGLAKKQRCAQIEHGYWTKSMQFLVIQIATAVSAANTTALVVTDASGALPGQIIRLAKAFSAGNFVAPEYMRVTAVNYGTNTLTVERGFAGTVASASIPSGTKLPVFTNAHPEGSAKPAPRAIVPTRVLNYTQIFRNAWALNKTLKATQMIAGKGAVAENKEDCAAFHATDIEFAALFGRKFLGTDAATGEPIHTMDGIEALVQTHAPTNLKEAGATTNYNQLEDLLDGTLDFKTDFMNGNNRTLFVGKTAKKVINNIGRLSGEYQIENGQTNFGLQFTSFQTSRGKFSVVEHPLLNTNEEYQKMAFVVDLSSFDFVYLDGRDTEHQYINVNSQNSDGSDAEGGVITSELTTQIMNPAAFGVIYNLRAAAA